MNFFFTCDYHNGYILTVKYRWRHYNVIWWCQIRVLFVANTRKLRTDSAEVIVATSFWRQVSVAMQRCFAVCCCHWNTVLIRMPLTQRQTTHECVDLVHARMTLLLLWPWPDDLNTRTWPRYSEDQKVSWSRLSDVGIRTEQTHRHRQARPNTLPATTVRCAHTGCLTLLEIY